MLDRFDQAKKPSHATVPLMAIVSVTTKVSAATSIYCFFIVGL
jgi:hypothetical protein